MVVTDQQTDERRATAEEYRERHDADHSPRE